MIEGLGDEDGLQSGFFNFIEALCTLKSTAEEQAARMPEGLIPWDVKDDALAGLFLRNHPTLSFSLPLIEMMNKLVTELDRLPDAALYPERPFTKESCLAAMKHPAWTPLRLQAAFLLQELKPAIQSNRKALNLE